PIVTHLPFPGLAELPTLLTEHFASAKEAAAAKLTQHKSNKQRTITLMQTVLEWLGQHCDFCLTTGTMVVHDAFDCPNYPGVSWYKAYKQSLNKEHKHAWSPNVACYYCAVPSLGGSNSLHTDYNQKLPCIVQNAIFSISFHVIRALRSDASADIDLNMADLGPNASDWALWAIQRDEECGTRMFKLVMWWYWTQHKQNPWSTLNPKV
ncbi:hypothetical protein CYLTODRAFT_414962, partial [Cylindrobasidium torrendii FP15055 ss-10]